MSRIILKAHPDDSHTTVLDPDATIEVQSGEGRAVISFPNDNLEIADSNFEGSIRIRTVRAQP